VLQWRGPAVVRALAYHPDGKQIVVAYANGQVELRDTTTGHLVQLLRRGEDTPKQEYPQIAVSPDGAVVMVAGSTGVNRWCLPHACPAPAAPIPVDDVAAMAFQPDNATLVISTRLLDVYICHLDATSDCDHLRFDQRRYSFLALSGDGRVAALSNFVDDRIDIRTIPAGELVATMTRSGAQLTPQSVSRSGTILAAGDAPSAVKAIPRLIMWDIASGTVLSTTRNDFRWLLTISPDQRFVVGGRTDFILEDDLFASGGNVWIWRIASGTFVDGFWSGPNEITALTFSPDSRYLAAGAGIEVRIWDMTTYH